MTAKTIIYYKLNSGKINEILLRILGLKVPLKLIRKLYNCVTSALNYYNIGLERMLK